MSHLVKNDSHLNDERKTEISAPSRLLLALEGRALLEMASLPFAMPWLRRRAPLGDGHAVLVIPGFLASDRSTVPLRRFLDQLGYEVSGWEQGRTAGPARALWSNCNGNWKQCIHVLAARSVSLVGALVGFMPGRSHASGLNVYVK